MNKKNYILNNANTRYFDYFFFKKLKTRPVNYLDLMNTNRYGITFTYDKSTGKSTFKGKATASGGVSITNHQGGFKAGTYTMKLNKPISFLINFTIETNVGFRLPAGTTSVTTTLTKDYEDVGALFCALTKDNEYDETFTLIMVKDS